MSLIVNTTIKKYINDRIPKKATNIFWQMFNGIEAILSTFEYRLNVTKRERNILTAQHLSSLRHLASNNGFEPTLKIPSKGILNININPKLFNRVGYPLFLPPYAVFTDKISKLNYYYNSDRSLRISETNTKIPVIEGIIKTVNATAKTPLINRIYLQDNNIADNSISVNVGGVKFTKVKSFFNNQGLYDDKQFIVKFSNDTQNPIIVYIKGCKYNDNIEIVYRLTNGEIGNIKALHNFTTESLLDNAGSLLDINDDEIEIFNFNGFDFGSNGTDENSLRAAIGYNHGSELLFDNISFANFLNKFSTLLVQSVKLADNNKTINNIYVSKKQALNPSVNNTENYIEQYKRIIQTKSYILSIKEKTNLQSIIDEFEFCLASNNLYDAIVNKFAFQILFKNQHDLTNYSDDVLRALYTEFGTFLHKKSYTVNIELIFEKIMNEFGITFQYTIFNQQLEEEKIKNSSDIDTPYIIKNDNYLPIIDGDFEIIDSSLGKFKLFQDVNIVSEN